MKISVITTVYNQKDFILETIDSVQQSLFAPYTDITWEHLIYDDASTDGTIAILRTITQPNIRCVYGITNRGPSHGRNMLMKEATGDYIFMIDGDDIILQRTLHNFIREAKNNPTSSWFIADFLRVDEQLRYLSGQDYYGWPFKSTQEMLAAIFRGEHFIQSNVFFKKSLFQEVGGFDETMKMTEDLDLFIRFLLKGHLPHYASFPTHLHRIHPRNLSTGVTFEKHQEHMRYLYKKYSPELTKQHIVIS